MIFVDELVDDDHFIEVILDKKDMERLRASGCVKQKVLLGDEVISLAVIAEHDIRTNVEWIGRPEENLIFRRTDDRRRKKTTSKPRDECEVCKLEFKRNGTNTRCARKNVRPEDVGACGSIEGDQQTSLNKRKISILKEDEYGRRRAVR